MGFLNEDGVARLWNKIREYFALANHKHPYVSSMDVNGITLTYEKGDGSKGAVTLPKGVTSWNDLEDKPFGEIAVDAAPSDTLTWDGDVTNKETVSNGQRVKISDVAPTQEDLANGFTIIYRSADGEVEVPDAQKNLFTSYDGIIMIGAFHIVIALKDVTWLGVSYTKGIWFTNTESMVITKLQINGYTGFTSSGIEIKKIDAKYLPDEAATKDYVNDAVESVSGIDLGIYQTKTDNTLNTTDKTVVGAINSLNSTIGNKVDKVSGKGLSTNDLTDTLKSNYDTAYSHVSNTSNPHGITLTTLGVSATSTELNYVDGVTSNIQTQLNNKASNTHTHPYVSSMNIDGTTLTYNKGDGTTGSVDLPESVTSWNDLQDKPFDDTTLVYKNSDMEMRKFIDSDGVTEVYLFRAEHFSLEFGKTYTVIIDGIEYEAVHGAIGTSSTLGDLNNQGFEITEATTICTILTKTQATSIEVIKQEVKQIDTKYLPEVTWNDLSNKPFSDYVDVYENNSMVMDKWTTEDDTEAIYVFEVRHFEFELELGKSYTVILDGVEHSVICNANGSNKIIGDTSVQGFRIVDYGNDQDILIITLQPATSIKVIKNEVQQLNTKYIPNVTTTNDGLMSSTDKGNFDTLYASAYTNLTTTDANALVKEVFG